MTDLEMTEACATAMGLLKIVQIGGEKFSHVPLGYDPLHDDSQAMALVKKCRLEISPSYDGKSWCVSGETEIIAEDLNSAIVECAARMQDAK